MITELTNTADCLIKRFKAACHIEVIHLKEGNLNKKASNDTLVLCIVKCRRI